MPGGTKQFSLLNTFKTKGIFHRIRFHFETSPIFRKIRFNISFYSFFSMRQGILPIFFLLFCLHFKFSTQDSLFAEPSFLKSTLLDTLTPSATIPTSNEYKAYLTLKTVRVTTFYQATKKNYRVFRSKIIKSKWL